MIERPYRKTLNIEKEIRRLKERIEKDKFILEKERPLMERERERDPWLRARFLV